MASADKLVHQAGIRDDDFNTVVRFKLNNVVIFAIFPHQGYIKANWLCSESGTHQPPFDISAT
jgi:hypothetical protein